MAHAQNALIQRVVELLVNSRRAVALTGAGISTPSGIPDFRSPSSGLWSKVNPMVVASKWGFRSNPQAFYEWIAPLAEQLLTAQPNPAHLALAEMERLGKLRAVITQNIDGLHQRAGSGRVLELHGHARHANCVRCHHPVPADQVFEQWRTIQQVPRCPECGGVLKPAVVLFGDLLPQDVWRAAENEARHCDLMLIAGSSLEVAPASDLPYIAYHAGARLILVNYQPTPLDHLMEVALYADVAEALPAIAAGVREALSGDIPAE